MPSRRLPYSTSIKFPSRRVEKRIKIPALIKRPVRFQVRTVVKHELLRGDAWWFTMHRRGPKQPLVGEDPLEARAIPHGMLRGTLPERIIYKALVEQYHFVPDVDFDFQSSLQGGRLETGGIVADFLFKILRIVINPLGPTHYEFLRMAKDIEQIQALEDLGYTVYMIDEHDVYNEEKMNEILRRIFGIYHGGASGYEIPDVAFLQSEGFAIEPIWKSVLELRSLV